MNKSADIWVGKVTWHGPGEETEKTVMIVEESPELLTRAMWADIGPIINKEIREYSSTVAKYSTESAWLNGIVHDDLVSIRDNFPGGAITHFTVDYYSGLMSMEVEVKHTKMGKWIPVAERTSKGEA